jgi:hypothetical protein
MAAALGKLLRVTDHHAGKLFENTFRQFHQRIIYHLPGQRNPSILCQIDGGKFVPHPGFRPFSGIEFYIWLGGKTGWCRTRLPICRLACLWSDLR